MITEIVCVSLNKYSVREEQERETIGKIEA